MSMWISEKNFDFFEKHEVILINIFHERELVHVFMDYFFEDYMYFSISQFGVFKRKK